MLTPDSFFPCPTSLPLHACSTRASAATPQNFETTGISLLPCCSVPCATILLRTPKYLLTAYLQLLQQHSATERTPKPWLCNSMATSVRNYFLLHNATLCQMHKAEFCQNQLHCMKTGSHSQTHNIGSWPPKEANMSRTCRLCRKQWPVIPTRRRRELSRNRFTRSERSTMLPPHLSTCYLPAAPLRGWPGVMTSIQMAP